MATALRFDHGVSLKMIQLDLNMKDYKKMKSWVTLCAFMLFFTCVVTGHERLESVAGTARSKAWFCGHWLDGTAGTYPTGSMDGCRL